MPPFTTLFAHDHAQQGSWRFQRHHEGDGSRSSEGCPARFRPLPPSAPIPRMVRRVFPHRALPPGDGLSLPDSACSLPFYPRWLNFLCMRKRCPVARGLAELLPVFPSFDTLFLPPVSHPQAVRLFIHIPGTICAPESSSCLIRDLSLSFRLFEDPICQSPPPFQVLPPRELIVSGNHQQISGFVENLAVQYMIITTFFSSLIACRPLPLLPPK